MNAPNRTMPAWWRLQRSDDCIVATAIHDGTLLRPEVEAAMALDAATRLREEDPFTGQAVAGVPTHIVPLRSRFEVDLNRAANDAVYLRPEQSWSLQVWREPPPDALVERSLRMHRAFYAMLAQLLDDVVATHGRFLLLDVHSYNHRRDGPGSRPMAAEDAPEINLGTFSMPRDRWACLVDPLIAAMRRFDFMGRQLDVRENVAFRGRGQLARFVHERYPGTGCSLAVEFKKFYMDEWTGEPDPAVLPAMRDFITHAADTGRALLHG